jgi:EmrB/QacA subfamily drug resistance transporter
MFALGSVVVLGTLLSVVDTTIVAIAIRAIGNDLHTSISTIQWVLTGYLLAFAGVIPITSWASERFGAKRVWIGALVLFIAGSMLAGTAWSIHALIAFRVVQGIGGGVLPPVGQAILGQAAGPDRLGRVMSIVGVPMVLGSVAGPVIGGLIVSFAGWRWIFYINLPLGAVALLLAFWLLPTAGSKTRKRVDLRGLILLPSGVVSLVYGLSELAADGDLSSRGALLGLGAGVALVTLYVMHARVRRELALIDVSLFRDYGFAVAASTNFVVSIALFGTSMLLALYWQIVRGESPLATGMLLAPHALAAAIAMPVAGWFTDKVGARVVVPIGIALALAGTAGYAQASVHTSHAFLVGALFVTGLGVGATNTPLLAAAFVMLSTEAIPRAISALHTLRRVGGSIGTAVLAIVLQRAITIETPELGDSALGPLASTTRTQLAPALANAFSQVFWVTCGLIVIALVLAMLLPRADARP